MRSRRSRRDRGQIAGAFAVVFGVVATLATLLSPAAAQEEDSTVEGLDIAVGGGVNGVFRPGRPAPIDVQIEADQLLTGVLEISSRVGGQTIVHRADIEVPAGSRKRFVVPVPTPASEQPSITVTFRLDGAEPEVRSVALEEQSDVELVGVLPLVTTVADLPESAELMIDAGTARLFAVSTELLGSGFDGLWIFDSIIATSADLEALASREMDAVLAWLTAGGHLLVDETGGAVPRLPAEWQPSSDRAAAAGRGLVRFTDGLAKAGMWDQFLLPTPIDSDDVAGNLDVSRFSGRLPGSLAADLSRDAGFALPPIADLLTLFAIYALVAGPVSYLILRRRGHSAALWVTIPVLSVATTIGVWFVGSELRSNTSAAHATVIVTSAGVDYATSHVLVGQDAGGIETPRGWIPTGRVGNSAYDGDAAELEVRPTGGGFDAAFDLTSGQFAIATARGVLDVDGLRVEAQSEQDGSITGTVTNESEVTVDHVTVVSAASGIDLGTIGSGESRPFSLSRVDEFTLDSFEWRAWGDSAWNDPTLGIGLWYASRAERGGVNAQPQGQVTVVGWTDEIDAPVKTLDGDTISAGQTLLVTNAGITPEGGRMSDMTSSAFLVRGPGDTGTDGIGGARLSGIYQFHTPEGWVDGPIDVHIPRYVVDLDIWQNDRWRSVQIDPGEERDTELNGEGFAIDGLIHVRLTIDSSQIFEFGNGEVPSISQGLP